MSQKYILNKVKTSSGYDTLFPLTPYDVHFATSVSGDAQNIRVNIKMPDSEITSPILVCFVASYSSNGTSNVTFKVNNFNSKILYMNNSDVAQINQGDVCLVYFDKNASSYKLLLVSNSTKLKKASQAQAEAGSDDSTYMTPLKTKQAIQSYALPSKQMSIKTGTISNNENIPQTSGYAHYMYLVSIREIDESIYVATTPSSVDYHIQCYVDQSTRKVTSRVYTRGSWKSLTSNYVEIAWN